jgi:hypothetical protein
MKTKVGTKKGGRVRVVLTPREDTFDFPPHLSTRPVDDIALARREMFASARQ